MLTGLAISLGLSTVVLAVLLWRLTSKGASLEIENHDLMFEAVQLRDSNAALRNVVAQKEKKIRELEKLLAGTHAAALYDMLHPGEDPEDGG